MYLSLWERISKKLSVVREKDEASALPWCRVLHGSIDPSFSLCYKFTIAVLKNVDGDNLFYFVEKNEAYRAIDTKYEAIALSIQKESRRVL